MPIGNGLLKAGSYRAGAGVQFPAEPDRSGHGGPKLSPKMDPSTDTALQDYVAIAINQGKYICGKDTMMLPYGTLFSNKKTAMYIFYKSRYEEMTTQLKYSKYLMNDYYITAKSAEVLYQKKIVDLEKSNQRSWLEQNSCYMGFVLGIGMAVLTEYTVLHVK